MNVPSISMIVAMTEDGIIGDDNRLIWHLPDDLKRFRNITMGHSIIMGRKTHESIGKALSGRKNIVLTKSSKIYPNCETANSLEQALEMCPQGDVFIIGGAQIYNLFMTLVSKAHVTLVHGKYDGDAFLSFDWDAWEILETEPKGSHTYYTLTKKPA